MGSSVRRPLGDRSSTERSGRSTMPDIGIARGGLDLSERFTSAFVGVGYARHLFRTWTVAQDTLRLSVAGSLALAVSCQGQP
jgi:hypothetical protein